MIEISQIVAKQQRITPRDHKKLMQREEKVIYVDQLSVYVLGEIERDGFVL